MLVGLFIWASEQADGSPFPSGGFPSGGFPSGGFPSGKIQMLAEKYFCPSGKMKALSRLDGSARRIVKYSRKIKKRGDKMDNLNHHCLHRHRADGKRLPPIYCDMDGVLADFNAEPRALERFAVEPNFFADLKPITTNVNAIKQLIADGYKVRILSASPNKAADKGKRKWLK